MTAYLSFVERRCIPSAVIWHKSEKLRNHNDKYQSHKTALSKLLKQNGLDMMSKDTEVINRIFQLLTEHSRLGKIEGIISTTEIVKYGGDIGDDKVRETFLNITNWWENNGF